MKGLQFFFSFAQFSDFQCFATSKQANKTGCIYWDVCLAPDSGQCVQSCNAPLGLALHNTAVSKWINSVQIQHWGYTLFHIHLGCVFCVDLNLDSWSEHTEKWWLSGSHRFHRCWCHCVQQANNDFVRIPSLMDVMPLLWWGKCVRPFLYVGKKNQFLLRLWNCPVGSSQIISVWDECEFNPPHISNIYIFFNGEDVMIIIG